MKSIISDMPEKGKKNDCWEKPGELALCRNIMNGSLVAGVLLHRILVIWKLRKTRLNRFNKEWLAMSRSDWARSAGLTESEMKNYALPAVKKHGALFLDFTVGRVEAGGPNSIWVSVNEQAIVEAVNEWEIYEMALNGLVPGWQKPGYAYKKSA